MLNKIYIPRKDLKHLSLKINQLISLKLDKILEEKIEPILVGTITNLSTDTVEIEIDEALKKSDSAEQFFDTFGWLSPNSAHNHPHTSIFRD